MEARSLTRSSCWILTIATACTTVACVSTTQRTYQPRRAPSEPLVVGRPAPMPSAVPGTTWAPPAVELAPKSASAATLAQFQLLDVDPPTETITGMLSVATSTRVSPGKSRIELHDVAMDEVLLADASRRLATPSVTVELDFDVLHEWTPKDRRPWYVLDVASAPQLVVRDAVKSRVLLIDVESGRVLFERGSCMTLEDARVRDGGADVIVRTPEGLNMIELGPTGTVRGWRELIAPDDSTSVAAFVSGEEGEEPPHEAVVVGFRAGRLVAVRADLIAGTERSYVVELANPQPSRLRVAAWGSDERRRIAIGMPDAFGFGRVALVADDVGERPAVLHDLMAEDVTPGALSGAAFASTQGYGWALRFVADVGGDGLPELAIAAAVGDGLGSPVVDLIDHGTGARLRGFALKGATVDTPRMGTHFSADRTGRFLGFTAVRPSPRQRVENAVVVDVRDEPALMPVLVPGLQPGR